jgi:hypothetical protein
MEIQDSTRNERKTLQRYTYCSFLHSCSQEKNDVTRMIRTYNCVCDILFLCATIISNSIVYTCLYNVLPSRNAIGSSLCTLP